MFVSADGQERERGSFRYRCRLWQPCSQFVRGELRSQSGIGVGTLAGTVAVSSFPLQTRNNINVSSGRPIEEICIDCTTVHFGYLSREVH